MAAVQFSCQFNTTLISLVEAVCCSLAVTIRKCWPSGLTERICESKAPGVVRVFEQHHPADQPSPYNQPTSALQYGSGAMDTAFS